MRILMIAADPMEFRWAAGTPVRSGHRWSRSLQLGGNDFLLVANGVGTKRASLAVDAVRDFRADAVVSTGFCGALSPELAIADIVVATTVTDGAQHFDAVQPQCARPHRTGTVVTIDHVAQTAAEKRKLYSAGATAVEMEAAGVAARAREYSLPYYCVRVVTDLAGEDMANDFNEALREDGHFATMNILKGTLRKPLVRLPELLRLRNRCGQAARALGEFIADCRF
jgi:adenosylhomocysteine nucleosidase